MPPENPHDPEPQQPERARAQGWRSLVGAGRAATAWAVASRLRAGLLLAASAASVAAVVVVGWWVIASSDHLGEPVTLDIGRCNCERIVRLIDRIQARLWQMHGQRHRNCTGASADISDHRWNTLARPS